MTHYRRHGTPEPFEARLLGRIEGCTNPESAELLCDGEHFVFGNCTLTVGIPSYRGGQGIVYKRSEAFISLARLSRDGEVSLLSRRHMDGLTATLGIDILRKGTSNFPEGTAFIAEGGNPILDDNDLVNPDTDAKPRLMAFDGLKGQSLGALRLDTDSPIGRKFNRIDQPNGAAIDAKGNLYVGDIPNGNPDADGPPPVPSAVYRIPHGAVDAIAAGDMQAAAAVTRILIPGFVNGLTSSPLDDAIWAVSCSAHDPAGGGLYRLSPDDFDSGTLRDPVIRDIGLFLDGVGVTRRGTLLASTPITGEIHAFTVDGTHLTIKAGGENIVRMPADFNVCYPAATGGEPCLLVTDISVGTPPGGGSVAVVEIQGL